MNTKPIAWALALSIVFPACALARLPPPSDEAKQKAADAADKSAWSDKVGAYKLCLAMDKTADAYRRSARASGKEPPAATTTPPCSDPGPYTPATLAAQKPLEASGAHSPPGTASGPPSTPATAAEISGKK